MFVSMRSNIPFKDEPKVHFTPFKKFSLISRPKKSLVKNLDTLIKKIERFCWTFIDLMSLANVIGGNLKEHRTLAPFLTSGLPAVAG